MESLRLERLHYQRVLGIDLEIVNPHIVLSTMASVALLAARYPHLVEHVTSCTSGKRAAETQHCLACEKCIGLALGFLAHGTPSPSIDYDRFLTHPRSLKMALTPSRERDEFGNGPMNPLLISPKSDYQMCDSLARIDPNMISDDAMACLREAIDLWGNTRFPAYYTLPDHIAAIAGDELTRNKFDIARQHFPVVDMIESPHLIDQPGVRYDHRIRFMPYTAGVRHLQ